MDAMERREEEDERDEKKREPRQAETRTFLGGTSVQSKCFYKSLLLRSTIASQTAHSTSSKSSLLTLMRMMLVIPHLVLSDAVQVGRDGGERRSEARVCATQGPSVPRHFGRKPQYERRSRCFFAWQASVTRLLECVHVHLECQRYLTIDQEMELEQQRTATRVLQLRCQAEGLPCKQCRDV